MIGKTRALGMGGASALAIGAVLTFVPGEAAACVATSQSDEGVVVSVDINCTGTPTVLPFTTRYTDNSEPETEIYDGDGNDTLTMTAGSIETTGDINTPRVDETFNLDFSDGVVQMLGGNDTVDISGTATIGADGAPINLELGDGDDNFVMSGGTLNGTVFGGEGDDDIEVSEDAIITGVPGVSAAIETGNGNNDVRILGGTIGTDPTQLAIFLEGGGVNTLEMSGGTVNGNIVGQGGGNTYTITGGVINGVLSAGSGNDTVTISGTANITGSDPDSVGLDVGDDTFTMTGGTLAGAVSGGFGNDRITIENGTIGSFVEGNEGDDTINISGGQIDGAVLGDLGNDNITISGGTIGAFVAGEDGNDTIVIGTAAGGPEIASSVFGDDGDDNITISGGTIGTTASPSDVSLGAGADVFRMSGGIVRGSLFAGDGNDTVTISGNAVIEGGEGFSSAGAAPVEAVAVELDDGDDILTMTGGTIGTSTEPDDIDLGAGADTFDMSGGTITGSLYAGIGNDNVTISEAAIIQGNPPSDSEPPYPGAVDLEEGDDRFTMTGGQIGTNVVGGVGNDRFTVSGGQIDGAVLGDLGDDDIEVSEDAIITGVPGVSAAIETGNGDNDVRILGGTIGTDPTQLAIFLEGGGVNTLEMSGGTVNGNIVGQGGGNTYTITGGVINGVLSAGSGNDTVTISGTANITGSDPDSVGLDVGDDTFTMTGGTLAGAVSGNNGDDTLTISGGIINSFVAGNLGVDRITVSGGSIAGEVLGGEGNDFVTISGGTVATNVSGDGGSDEVRLSAGRVGGNFSGGAGDDTVVVNGGTVVANVLGEDGNDQMTVSAGNVEGSVDGGVGTDAVTISGGTIAGDVVGETITLSGGTIGGDITGISGNTLIINGTAVGDPLNLRNGVVFSGTNAVATITNEDLAAGGTKTQNFVGFDTVSASSSTLGFATGTQGIGLLNLGDGSTLFVNGSTNMAGNAVVTGSTIDMLDGAADDVFTLGGLTLNGGTIGLDLNQQTGLADQLVAGTFTSSGANTILVNLLGAPEFAQPTDIPIIVSTNGPLGGTFVTGISGTPSALFTYELIAGANGGLFIRATPANFGIATAPDSAVNAGTVNTAIDALYGINDDAIDSDLGLAHGAQRVQISPTFGVFASGQFAHTEHDGFTISGNGLVGAGPGFDADDFSAAISLDFNAAKHFEFEDRYGLNLGLFAGYASTDVGLGAFQGFDAIGDATNRSGMFGGYALFRQGVNYALVSASAFLGETDVSNGVLNTTGSYDTEGYAVTGSIGHIFALTDRVRFDLRGGMLGVSFTGDDYTDSGGNQFGESRISFGAFKFEPGIYADYTLDNGMVFSPYARADFQQRFAYKNTATIDGREIDFDDADFSAALSTGFNLKMSERATLSSEIRGKLSADSSTIGGKLGLKIAF